MNLKTVLASSMSLGFALCAAPPGAAFADDSAAVKPPLLVSEYLSAPTWVYYKNSDQYHSLAFANKEKIYNRFTAVHFTNTSTQAITGVQFDLTAYDNNKPILDADGKPMVKHLVASGTLAPGEDRIVKNDNTVWALPHDNQFTCARLTAIKVSYADGSSQDVTTPEAVHQAVAPQVNMDCSGPYAPVIAGVYPPHDVIMGIENQVIWHQPFVPPSDTAELN
ncbi:MAG TPA: hypothetical protein VGM47_05570 [Gammaproteobacteria bacterium]|jgi:hypothetical protein